MSAATAVESQPDAHGQPETPTDQELVAAANQGDAAAFEALYYRYRDWVVGLAARLTGDPDAALDVLQDTFLYFLKKFPGFRLTASLRTFLYPAVRNLSIAARRKAARYQSDATALESLGNVPDAQAAAGDREALAAALARPSEQQREALWLRFVEGFSINEVAAALQIPAGTVKSRLHNGLAALRADPRTRDYFQT